MPQFLEGEMIIDQDNFALMVSDHLKEQATFKDHPIEDHKRKWQENIRKEFKEMCLQGV